MKRKSNSRMRVKNASTVDDPQLRKFMMRDLGEDIRVSGSAVVIKPRRLSNDAQSHRGPKSSKAFAAIAEGLKDAIAHVKGDRSRGRARRVRSRAKPDSKNT